MTRYSIEPRTRKHVKGYAYLSFGGNLSILVAAIKTGLEDLKAATKKVTHKAAEATAEFIRSKIADKIVKSKLMPRDNLRNVEEIIIPTEKREEILVELRQVL